MEVTINVREPERVGNIVYYRLCALPSYMRIMETTNLDKVFDHLQWLIENGVTVQKFAIMEIHGTEYKREIEISENL